MSLHRDCETQQELLRHFSSSGPGTERGIGGAGTGRRTETELPRGERDKVGLLDLTTFFVRSPFMRERSRTPTRDRDRVSSERKVSSRSHRSRSRSRSRSPKRPRKEFTTHDTSLFAEMRKKKHLRDKLEARKSSNLDHSANLEGRKSSSSSEKGSCCCCCCCCLPNH